MNKRTGAVMAIAAGGACAGLLWASQANDLVRRSFFPRASAPTAALPDARLRAGAIARSRTQAAGMSGASSQSAVGFARPSMSAVSLVSSSYSMAPPEFLSDPAAAGARSVDVGDISGDGRDDIAFIALRSAANPADSRMEIYVAYQRSDGRLDAAVRIAESNDAFATRIATADLDRDGRADIVTTTLDGVLVLRTNGDGTFASSTAVAGDPADFSLTDVDRDGDLDILVDSSNTSATVVHGDGLGGIAGTSTLPLPASAVRTTGDVTGDGLDDLILATIFNRPMQEFRIYPALASGGYAAPIVLSRPQDANQTSSLAVGDFNADGRGDLILDEARDGASLQLYLQDAQGNLGPSVAIPRERGGGVLMATDLDRDRRTDVVMGHSGWGYIGYYLQTAAGLTPETVVNAYQFQGRAYYFAAGDLNRDGCGDLIIARTSQSPVLLYGRGCPRPRIANCRLPPTAVQSPALPPAGLMSPLANRHDGDAAANLGAELPRSVDARLRNGRR
ncbi:MAG: FG-GAP repeat domain-containing protein [Pseudomonadota bacterium]